MKKIILLASALLISFNLFSLETPALSYYVNDYAGFISPKVKTELEQKLKSFENSDSTQIVILTIPSLEGEALEEYSIKVAQKNGIGQKGKDNGILLLVSKADRKIRIEVGYGLEGKMTDLMAGRIVDNIITPNFKKGDMDAGFIQATNAMIGVVKGEFKADDLKRKKNSKPDYSFLFAILFIVFFLIVNFTRGFKVPVRGLFGGGFGIAALTGLFFFTGFPGSMALLIPLLLGGGALSAVITIIASLFMGLNTGHHGSTGGFFGGSGGGFSSGGDSGFSGGGGSFGGGGSSGSW